MPKWYRGACASRHCSSRNGRGGFKTRPQGRHIPDNFNLPLRPEVTPRNRHKFRICETCYHLYDQKMHPSRSNRGRRVSSTPSSCSEISESNSGTLSSTPAIRPFLSRNRRTPRTTPMRSRSRRGALQTSGMQDIVKGRSQAYGNLLEECKSMLGDTITMDTEHFLTLLHRPCHCEGCNGTMGIVSRPRKSGIQWKLKLKCKECNAGAEFTTHPNNGKASIESLQDGSIQVHHLSRVLETLLAGSTFKEQDLLGGNVSETTFYRLQRLLVDVVVDVCQQQLKDIRLKMVDRFQQQQRITPGDKVGFQGQANGAWSHRGWHARHFSYVLRDCGENRPIVVVLLMKSHELIFESGKRQVKKGSYVGTSKQMEGEGLRQTLDILEEDKLLSYMTHLVTDGDLSVAGILQEKGATHVKHVQDPGHVVKNFGKQLKKIFVPSGNYALFAPRIGRFYMRCLKRAEKAVVENDTMSLSDVVVERSKVFNSLWAHAYGHYTREHCPTDCPCQQLVSYGKGKGISAMDIAEIAAFEKVLQLQDRKLGSSTVDAVGDVEEEIGVVEMAAAEAEASGLHDGDGKKIFLNVQKRMEKKLADKMKPLLELMGRLAPSLLTGINTCMSENTNWRRLVFVRKDRFYPSTYDARSLVSALLETLTRTQLYKLVWKKLGLQIGAHQEELFKKYAKHEKQKRNDNKRRRSTKYKIEDAKATLKKKAQAQKDKELTQLKKEQRKHEGGDYDVVKDSVLPHGQEEAEAQLLKMFAASKRGPKSQSTLKAAYDAGIELGQGPVELCDSCGRFFYAKKSHKCRGKGKSKKSTRKGKSENPTRRKRQRHATQTELEEAFNDDMDLGYGRIECCDECGVYYHGDLSHKCANRPRKKTRKSKKKEPQVARRTSRRANKTIDLSMIEGDDNSDDMFQIDSMEELSD